MKASRELYHEPEPLIYDDIRIQLILIKFNNFVFIIIPKKQYQQLSEPAPTTVQTIVRRL